MARGGVPLPTAGGGNTGVGVGVGGHWEREGGPPDGTAAGKAGHWLPGVTSGHPSPHPLPAFRAHSPCVGGVSAEEGSGGCRHHTRPERVVQLENKLERNFIFSSSEADLGVSAPLPGSHHRRFHEKKPQTRGSNRPCVPISLRICASARRRPEPGLGSGWTDRVPGGWTPGRPSLAVSASQT